ncbi:MAG: IS701 family transposase, partial [Acinetobacter sp.]
IFMNIYQWQKNLFKPIIKNFIHAFISDKNHLLPQKLQKG